MNLYVIYTRQSERGDSQYYSAYHVWAESESQARLLFQRRLKYAVIQNIFAVSADDGPLSLLAAG